VPETDDPRDPRPTNAAGDPMERRTDPPPSETAVHRIVHDVTQSAVKGVESKMTAVEDRFKVWREMTAFTMLLFIVYTLGKEFVNNSRAATDNAAALVKAAAEAADKREAQNREDMKEIQAKNEANLKGLQESHTRGTDALVGEVRAMGTKMEAVSVSNAATASEVRASRVSMERTEKELVRAIQAATAKSPDPKPKTP
jgi:hypothetical protein